MVHSRYVVPWPVLRGAHLGVWHPRRTCERVRAHWLLLVDQAPHVDFTAAKGYLPRGIHNQALRGTPMACRTMHVACLPHSVSFTCRTTSSYLLPTLWLTLRARRTSSIVRPTPWKKTLASLLQRQPRKSRRPNAKWTKNLPLKIARKPKSGQRPRLTRCVSTLYRRVSCQQHR